MFVYQTINPMVGPAPMETNFGISLYAWMKFILDGSDFNIWALLHYFNSPFV